MSSAANSSERRERGPLNPAKPTICLIRPPVVEAFRFSTASITLPLGLAYVSASLRKEAFDVKIIDAVGEAPDMHTRYCKGYLVGLRFEQIVDRIPAETDIIGISVIFTPEWPAVVQLIEKIRGRFPQAKIVLGGEHVTSMTEFSLLSSKADIAVMGEGEETVVELVRCLRAGESIADVAGIAYRDGTRVQVNPRRERKLDIDNIATPDWD